MTVAIVLLTAALIIVVALLASAAVGKPARTDGATYPTALTRAAASFAAVVTPDTRHLADAGPPREP
ncbi:hypothetical protein ACWDA9_27715 [Streptomyces sp. NPDC001193]